MGRRKLLIYDYNLGAGAALATVLGPGNQSFLPPDYGSELKGHQSVSGGNIEIASDSPIGAIAQSLKFNKDASSTVLRFPNSSDIILEPLRCVCFDFWVNLGNLASPHTKYVKFETKDSTTGAYFYLQINDTDAYFVTFDSANSTRQWAYSLSDRDISTLFDGTWHHVRISLVRRNRTFGYNESFISFDGCEPFHDIFNEGDLTKYPLVLDTRNSYIEITSASENEIDNYFALLKIYEAYHNESFDVPTTKDNADASGMLFPNAVYPDYWWRLAGKITSGITSGSTQAPQEEMQNKGGNNLIAVGPAGHSIVSAAKRFYPLDIESQAGSQSYLEADKNQSIDISYFENRMTGVFYIHSDIELWYGQLIIHDPTANNDDIVVTVDQTDSLNKFVTLSIDKGGYTALTIVTEILQDTAVFIQFSVEYDSSSDTTYAALKVNGEATYDTISGLIDLFTNKTNAKVVRFISDNAVEHVYFEDFAIFNESPKGLKTNTISLLVPVFQTNWDSILHLKNSQLLTFKQLLSQASPSLYIGSKLARTPDIELQFNVSDAARHEEIVANVTQAALHRNHKEIIVDNKRYEYDETKIVITFRLDAAEGLRLLDNLEFNKPQSIPYWFDEDGAYSGDARVYLQYDNPGGISGVTEAQIAELRTLRERLHLQGPLGIMPDKTPFGYTGMRYEWRANADYVIPELHIWIPVDNAFFAYTEDYDEKFVILYNARLKIRGFSLDLRATAPVLDQDPIFTAQTFEYDIEHDDSLTEFCSIISASRYNFTSTEEDDAAFKGQNMLPFELAILALPNSVDYGRAFIEPADMSGGEAIVRDERITLNSNIVLPAAAYVSGIYVKSVGNAQFNIQGLSNAKAAVIEYRIYT